MESFVRTFWFQILSAKIPYILSEKQKPTFVPAFNLNVFLVLSLREGNEKRSFTIVYIYISEPTQLF
jgi:hypothetical protein